jgi:peptidoglycan/xylan/chitin deacetylase (PgdA/CDA1 family)
VGNSIEHSWSNTSIGVEDFEYQIRYLYSKCNVMPLDEMLLHLQAKKTLPPKTVAITFDDGYKDNYTNAYPILRKYSLPAIIFLTTCHIDTGELIWSDKVKYAIMNTGRERVELKGLGMYSLHSHDDRKQAYFDIVSKLKEFLQDEKNLMIKKLLTKLAVSIPNDLGKEVGLSWDEIREMSNNGITFGAHTVTHAILTKLPLEETRKEILESKKRIEEEVGMPVTTFSYPNGGPADFNNEIKSILKQNGFMYAVTASPPKLVTPDTDLWELGRISMGLNIQTCMYFPDYIQSQIL